MNTAAQAPEGTTTDADDSGSRDFVRGLTTYAMHAGPERTDQMLRQAYSDLVPGSAARSQALDDDLAGRPRGTGPVRRRLAQDKAQRWSTCAYERCSQVFEHRAPNHRFCSVRCRWKAARRREWLRPLPPSRGFSPQEAEEFRQEAEAALADLRALVGAEEA